MFTLLIALAAGVAFIVAYHTYGRWLGRKVFNLAADAVCPSAKLRDDQDYIPTAKSIVFGHHFTSIAGTGPIVGPAIAVMWGWLPALLWVVLGSIFIGAVHDLGSLVVSLRNNGQTVGDIAGRLLNKRVRLLFLLVLFLALSIVLAIFGLVIASVFRQYPSAIFPCLIQVPIAVAIGLWLHRQGKSLMIPSILALLTMYVTVIFGDVGVLHSINSYLASLSNITWVILLLVYSYVASVLPVWSLLQPRDYINSLQLVSALGLIVLGLVVAAFIGGAPPVEGADRQPLEIVAPMVNAHPEGAPPIYPFLFVTIACGAISGFHCLVSSGTSSKQLKRETDAQFVGFGSMLTEGFLATLVILACVAGLGLGLPSVVDSVGFYRTGENGRTYPVSMNIDSTERQGSVVEAISGVGVVNVSIKGRLPNTSTLLNDYGVVVSSDSREISVVGETAFVSRYSSWQAAGGLARTVGAFVDGAANLLRSMSIPINVAVALMGVLVASFAGTTLDTACRLQRYVVQELAGTFVRRPGPGDCQACGYDLTGNASGSCPECGAAIVSGPPNSREGLGEGAGSQETPAVADAQPLHPLPQGRGCQTFNPLAWLTNKHGATVFAIVVAMFIAAMPVAGASWSWANAGKGGLILWPMFGATNQLLGGLAFLVITFWLWRRAKPIWFAVLPLVFMLIMPAWAMLEKLPDWWAGDANGNHNWLLIVIAAATLLLEAWMVVEAVLLFPRVKGVLEEQLPAGKSLPAA